MREIYKFYASTVISALLNFFNNGMYQVFTPVFTERALKRGIGETWIGVILAIYAFSMISCFTLDRMQLSLGSKRVYLMSILFGALASGLSIAINHSSRILFIIMSVILRIAAGLQET